MAESRKNGAVPTRKRLLTGLRPTGKYHLGNYVGTFEKDLELQNSGEYECFFLVADFHALTTDTTYEHVHQIGEDIREGVLDFLAVGIDPNRSTLYLQSLIPEVSELFLLFTMLVSKNRAERIPTLKEQVRDLKLESASLGLLNYPVLDDEGRVAVEGATVVDRAFAPGVQRVPLQAAGRVLRAGTYYADLEVGGQRVRRTLVFLD